MENQLSFSEFQRALEAKLKLGEKSETCLRSTIASAWNHTEQYDHNRILAAWCILVYQCQRCMDLFDQEHHHGS